MSGDTSTSAAPLRNVTVYHVTIDTAAGGFRIAGAVDSTALTAGGNVPARTADTSKSTFSAHLDTLGDLTALTATGGAPASCSAGLDPVVAGAQVLFVTLPARLEPGMSWQDSTTTVTCRGSVPVTSVLRRTYTVADSTSLDGQPAVRVDIATASTLAGAGLASAAGDSISVRGSGTATGALVIDAETAMPLSGTISGHSMITVTSRHTTLPFDQRTTSTITLLGYQPGTP